jgi:hypothetical protein
MNELGRHIRSRCTYANVIATVALFVALGGGAYAAATLPRNSVGSTQIRAAAVGTSELRNGGVGGGGGPAPPHHLMGSTTARCR